MTSLSGTYQPGDTITITTTFNEVVVVDASASAGLPTLSLTSNGELLPIVATYQGGSGTKSLRFQYQITETDASATSLNVSAFNFNGGRVTDLSGNLADVAILSGQNDFPAAVSVNINTSGNVGTTPEETGPQDTVAATILSIRAVQGDGTYQVGDALVFRVKLSELVNVDVTNGVPMLVLSNGGVALYSGGSGTDELSFSYDVKASDRNSEQLSVLGVAENDASLLDIAGNETDVRILPANDLSQTNLVKINAQAPYVRTIDAIDGIYLPGDEIRLEVRFSEAIAVDGTPTLKLSNNGVASYLSGAGTDTLVFSYTVPCGQPV